MSVGPVDYIVKSADYEKLFDHIRGAATCFIARNPADLTPGIQLA
jgi:hypothetical protein